MAALGRRSVVGLAWLEPLTSWLAPFLVHPDSAPFVRASAHPGRTRRDAHDPRRMEPLVLGPQRPGAAYGGMASGPVVERARPGKDLRARRAVAALAWVCVTDTGHSLLPHRPSDVRGKRRDGAVELAAFFGGTGPAPPPYASPDLRGLRRGLVGGRTAARPTDWRQFPT